MLRGLLLTLLTAAAVLAADVPLQFSRLDLRDGRKLKDVVVKSYDAKSEKLLLVASGKAMTVPIALLPAPLNEQLKAAAPRSGESVSTTTRPPMATAADQYGSSNAIVIPTPAPPVGPRAPSAPSPAPAPDPALVPARLAQHQAVARAHAQRYFRYEYQIGSNSISVTALDLDLSTPKPVPGWDGRYETQGKAFLEFYDSKGGSFQRATSTFEITTGERPGEDLKVIEFRRKS